MSPYHLCEGSLESIKVVLVGLGLLSRQLLAPCGCGKLSEGACMKGHEVLDLKGPRSSPRELHLGVCTMPFHGMSYLR